MNRVPPPRPPRPPWAPLPSKCSVPGGTLWTLRVQGGTRDGDNIGNPARASASLADQAKRLRPFDAPGWSPRNVPAGNPPALPPRALMAPRGQRVGCGLGAPRSGTRAPGRRRPLPRTKPLYRSVRRASPLRRRETPELMSVFPKPSFLHGLRWPDSRRPLSPQAAPRNSRPLFGQLVLRKRSPARWPPHTP